MMTERIARLPLQRQLTVFGLLASLGSLLVAGPALLGFQLRSIYASMVDDLERTAAIVAANATVALSFDNAGDARDILATLRTQPEIESGCIFTPDGNRFACYQRPAGAGTPLAVVPTGHRYADGHLTLALPIVRDEKHLGTIVVRSDTAVIRGLAKY